MKKKYYYQQQSTPGTYYNLTVVANPDSTYGNAYGSGSYLSGSSVQISAIPNAGYRFIQWKEGESQNPIRYVTVNGNATYNALFYKISSGELRVVDTLQNLYTYSEYQQTSIGMAGVAILDGEDWLVCYKQNIGITAPDDEGGIVGYRLGNIGALPSGTFTPSSVQSLLYPHSGLSSSLVYKNYFGQGSVSSPFAAYQADQLTTGNLTWYIPNLYEITQILQRAEDSSSGAHDGINSYLRVHSAGQIINRATPGTKKHAYWTSDVGIGGGETAGNILPYRVYYSGNTNFSYMSSGDYTYPRNYNYVRPVARIPAVYKTITYDGNGADSGTVPANTVTYKGDTAIIAINSGNLEKTGYTFNGWNTSNDGLGTHYNVGHSFHNHSDMALYAEWIPNQI